MTTTTETTLAAADGFELARHLGAELDALTRAVQAFLAAEAAGMPNPRGWLRDALRPDQIPPAGARPTDYIRPAEADAVWGRW
jgi:hypothetical protein